jgi:tetratricopeptide (TPR) repeat protein
MKNTIWILCLLIVVGCGTESEVKTVETGINISEDSTGENVVLENPLTALEEEILGSPESPNGYYKRALYYKNHYKFKKAVDDINRALKLAPESAAMNYAKAEIQYASAMYKGDVSLLDQAEIYLNYALEYDSINADALLLLAELKAAYSEPDKAMVYVNRVLKENQYLPRPYYVKGKIYESLGNMKLAESSYQTAIEMDANYYAAMIQLGWIYAQQQNDLALTYYDAALEIFPKSMEAIRNKGLYLHFSDRHLEARTYFNMMLEIDSTFEEAYFNIGNTYVGIYRDDMVQYTKDTIVDKALENFKRAVDINPGYIQAWYNLGLGYEVRGDTKAARDVYNYILSIETNYELLTA